MQWRFENQILDSDRRELWRGSEPVSLEPQVFDLLLYLIQNRDRVVSKDDLIAGCVPVRECPLWVITGHRSMLLLVCWLRRSKAADQQRRGRNV